VLLCIGTAANLDDPKRFRFDGQGFYVKDGDEMWEVFHDHRRRRGDAGNCRALRRRTGDGSTAADFQVPVGTTREQVLEEIAWTGLRRASASTATNRCRQVRRLRRAHEVRAVGDPVDGLRRLLPDRGGLHRLRATHRCAGRPGTRFVAGSLVAYGSASRHRPIEYDILFERFLNPERVSMPDIDVDFCMRGRDSVIRYVAENTTALRSRRPTRCASRRSSAWGRCRRERRCAMSAARSHAYADVDRIAKLVPEALGTTLEEAHQQSPELAPASKRTGRWLACSRRAQARRAHAPCLETPAGVVIGNRPLIETVPLYRDARSGDIMTQYDMRCVEKSG